MTAAGVLGHPRGRANQASDRGTPPLREKLVHPATNRMVCASAGA